MKVAILGAGPSGMMAAHAASENRHYVDIFDKDPDMTRRNSGVYFLHSPCNLPLEPIRIRQQVLGIHNLPKEEVPNLYGLKVYGKSVPKNSILEAMKNSETIGFDAGKALMYLWDMYGNQVQRRTIGNMEDVKDFLYGYDRVISTIPAYILFPDEKLDSIKTTIKVGTSPLNESFVLYNINPHCNWYRTSAFCGTFVQEYGFEAKIDKKVGYEYKEVTKVLGEGLKSPYPALLLAGRYGAWKKTTLTHNVFEEVRGWLA